MKELTKKKKLKRRDEMLVYGFKHKLVFRYPDILFDHLRPYCVGGFPASVMFMVNEMCKGYCYDRVELVQLAFDECQIVHADIESLRITVGKKYSEHAFIETPEFGGGKTWVVDTSVGLIFDKDFYYKIEKPKVNRVISKKEIMKSRAIKRIIASRFEDDKFALPIYLPFIEKAIEKSNHLGTVMYKNKAKEELEIFKKTIGYDSIVAEIEEDVKMMYENPQALDEKFQIKKDRYGREISRGGKPNPYYTSPEELDADEAYLKSIQGDKEKEKEHFEKIVRKTLKQMDLEDEKISQMAEERLAEIKQNPVKNFYERTK